MRSDMFNPNNLLIQKIKEKGGFINAHAHFDRAYTVTENNMEKVVNYHLFDKWQFVDKFKREATSEEYLKNIVSAIRGQIDYGVKGALTFIDIDTVCGFKAIEAAQEAKRLYEGKFDLKICSQALKGVIKPEENKLLRKALDMDYIDVIGGLPRADEDYAQAHLDEILFLGKEYGKRVHVHVDQLNNDLERETELLAHRTMYWGMEDRVTAVHGISIAAHKKEYRETATRFNRSRLFGGKKDKDRLRALALLDYIKASRDSHATGRAQENKEAGFKFNEQYIKPRVYTIGQSAIGKESDLLAKLRALEYITLTD